jgi:hypothetical protein
MAASIVDICFKLGNIFFSDPLFAAMSRNEVKWGDLLTGTEPLPASTAAPVTPDRKEKAALECPDAPKRTGRKIRWADEAEAAAVEACELDTSAEIERESDDESEVSYGPIVFFKPDEDDMPWLDKSEPAPLPDFEGVDGEFDFIPAIKRKSFKTPSFVGGARAPAPFPAGRKTLMAKNLPRETITVAKLRMVFEPFGTVKDVYIPKNYYDGSIKGFAKIEFLSSESAEAAYNKLFGALTIDGNFIGLEPAKEDRRA